MNETLLDEIQSLGLQNVNGYYYSWGIKRHVLPPIQNTEIFLVKSIKLEALLTTTFLDDIGSFVFILL